MVRAFFRGQMDVAMKVSISMIKSTALASIHGQMVASMQVNGKTANNTGKAYTKTSIKSNAQAFGNTASVKLGSTTKISKNKWKK